MASRIWRWATVAFAVAVVAPAMASAAELTVNDDTTGPGPAGADCANPDHNTIQAAIDAAAAAGDTIFVCAGTYDAEPGNRILINKSVDIIGDGPGSSIIDGNEATGLPQAGLIRTTDATNGDVLVEGFTLQGAGQVGTGANTARFAINVLGNDAGTTNEFAELEIIGRGVGGRDYGFYGQNADNDVVLRNSTIDDTDFNPVLIERVNGEVTIEDNEITKDPATTNATGIFAFTHSNDHVTNPWRIIGNEIDAGGITSGISVQTGLAGGGTNPAQLGPVEVIDNVVTNFTVFGVGVTNTSAAANGENGEISDVEVSGNTLTEPAASGARIGVRVMGLVSDVSIDGNDLRNLEYGIALREGPQAAHEPTGVDANFNRIVGNETGLQNATDNDVDAENNWWGCNEGPDDPACDSVEDTGAGTTDYDPWLVLGLSADPTSIPTGGAESEITVSLQENSDGETPENNVLPGPFEVEMSTTRGDIDPTTVTLDSDLLGTATLTSGNQPGTATVTGELDNAAPSVDVEFTGADVPAWCPYAIDGDNVQGGPGDDQMVGTDNRDLLLGGGGDDEIHGLRGDDCLAGEQGDDLVFGGAGADYVRGGGGDDLLRGNKGRDNINGNNGADTVIGGEGRDILRGGPGPDVIRGGSGPDRIVDTKGQNVIHCGGGNDTVVTNQASQVHRSCENVRRR